MPPPREPPPLRGAFLGVGLLVGALFWLLGRCAADGDLAPVPRTAARVVLGVSVAVWGLVAGFVGCFLIYVWGWTDHAVAHRNQNLLVCPPWGLALLVAGIGVVAGWPRAIRAARVAGRRGAGGHGSGAADQARDRPAPGQRPLDRVLRARVGRASRPGLSRLVRR